MIENYGVFVNQDDIDLINLQKSEREIKKVYSKPNKQALNIEEENQEAEANESKENINEINENERKRRRVEMFKNRNNKKSTK